MNRLKRLIVWVLSLLGPGPHPEPNGRCHECGTPVMPGVVICDHCEEMHAIK